MGGGSTWLAPRYHFSVSTNFRGCNHEYDHEWEYEWNHDCNDCDDHERNRECDHDCNHDRNHDSLGIRWVFEP